MLYHHHHPYIYIYIYNTSDICRQMCIHIYIYIYIMYMYSLPFPASMLWSRECHPQRRFPPDVYFSFFSFVFSYFIVMLSFSFLYSVDVFLRARVTSPRANNEDASKSFAPMYVNCYVVNIFYDNGWGVRILYSRDTDVKQFVTHRYSPCHR